MIDCSCGSDRLVRTSDGTIYCKNCKRYWEMIAYYRFIVKKQLK
ncbi:MAG: hypothetical protein OEM18_01600 [Nitrosopumilus sp.]|nr:hypothetical protein [Nitrosopumilus sp.]